MHRIRRRVPEDVAVLRAVLLDQQHETRYPFRDPLPVPVEQFLHADDAEAAWTAVVDGVPQGHVCRVGRPRHFAGAEEMNAACAGALRCEQEELAWISALFVGRGVRGRGLGRLLLETVVEDIRGSGSHACLEVLPVHPAALALYEATGWRRVLATRPDWLVAEVGHAGPDVVVMVLP